MSTNPSCLVWNVRGLNERAQRNVVRELVILHDPSLVCLQETKISNFCNSLANETLGNAFDYVCLPSVGASGGILLGWRREFWMTQDVVLGSSFVCATLLNVGVSPRPWCISVVYGPHQDADQVLFLDDLLSYGSNSPFPWLAVGDFNMIYRAADKNNSRLNCRSMCRFRSFINRAQLEEVPLIGRHFTWSNERENPTLELLDRVFGSTDWMATFPRHMLRPLSTDCSDHCPLLLQFDAFHGVKRRFHFEPHWAKFLDFKEVVAAAWTIHVFSADPFRILDFKFRNVAKELKSWSNKKIGSIRLQSTLTREAIMCLDEEMERRQLSSWEAELRRSLKMRVLGLASLSRSIARQRSRVLYLAEGDANTRFYHLQACHRRRRSRIDSLMVDGMQVVQDRQMADALFNFYNNLLGTDFARSRRFDLQAIGLPSLDLAALERMFTEEEVRAVISELPSHKAPGPDGFTGLFYKLAWDIIKPDIMNAMNAFWAQDARSLCHLNGAYMILLRKKENPEAIADYRPISLVHSFAKLVTKCLARRLSTVLPQLVQPNQSAFIQGRCIHDNFRSVSLACKSIYAKRSPCILLKIDIAKAFDTVAWTFLLEVLQHMGFGLRWRNWLSALLASSNTRILLNGRVGRRICHARGLRQGDPLSPMLFVIVMEVLNLFLRWLERRGSLTPIRGLDGRRVSLYADDLVLFVAPLEADLLVVRAALNIFGLASGLLTNLDKTMAIPIHCSEVQVERTLTVLSCRLESFPCRYLGVPLSVFRLKRSDEQPLIDRVAARIPGWKGTLLNAAGRTAFVTATMSAIPIHMSMVLCLSAWAIETIDKLRRGFIWAGVDKVSGGRCKVAWPVVCLPKELGGLGISDLRKARMALRARWVWKEWIQGLYPSTNERVVLALFQAATSSVGDGASTLFWTDRWIQGSSLQFQAPTVFAAVRPRKLRSTVAEAMQNNNWVRHISGAVIVQMMIEVAWICDRLDEVHLSTEPDSFSWKLSADQCYSAASAYSALFFSACAPLGARHVWKTSAPPRVRFFFWLVLHDR